jgi:predicted metal-dependent hydrolase
MKINVIRSRNRKKTAQAVMKKDEIVVRIPFRMSKDEELKVVRKLTDKLLARKHMDEINETENLQTRAEKLNRKYFNGRLNIKSVSFVGNRKSTFATCFYKRGEITVSECLRNAPTWVLDYVLIHEMAHFIHPNHSKNFWECVNRFPLTERARGFLIAMAIEEDDSGYNQGMETGQ